MNFTMKLVDYEKELCEKIVANTLTVSQRKQAYWKLKLNPWLYLSWFFAPGNLTIREWCLLDLLTNRPKHAGKIKKMLCMLSYNGTMWAEGAYYWLYMREILDVWEQTFPFTGLQFKIPVLIEQIHRNIVALSFKQPDGVYCTAPYGDVRIIRKYFGIDDELQHSLFEIATQLCITRERVRQIVAKRLKRIRQNYEQMNGADNVMQNHRNIYSNPPSSKPAARAIVGTATNANASSAAPISSA